MIEVVGIRFKKAGKMYYFDPAGIKLEKEDGAIVETARGIEYGTVIKGNSFVPEEAIVPPLKQVMRRATEEDTKSVEQNHKKDLSGKNLPSGSGYEAGGCGDDV